MGEERARKTSAERKCVPLSLLSLLFLPSMLFVCVCVRQSLKAKIEAGTVKPSVLHRLKTLEEKRRQRELQLALEL